MESEGFGRVQKIPATVNILSQTNPFHTLSTYFFTSHSNII
jgi:hypothetical protein